MVADDSIKLDGLTNIRPEEIVSHDKHYERQTLLQLEATMRQMIYEMNLLKTQFSLLKSEMDRMKGGM